MEARLLIEGRSPGTWNMALDEALLASAVATGQPCLRFYGWEEPTISLGYFQAYDDRQSHAASRSCAIVRRTTGGGAIVHDQELTYSLTAPLSDARFANHRGLGDLFHQTLIETLINLEIPAVMCGSRTSLDGEGGEDNGRKQHFLCFRRRTAADVLVGTDKICGSAQRKHRGAILQHGSILLSASASAPELPGLAELTGRSLAVSDLIGDWVARLAHRLGIKWIASERQIVEIEGAHGLESQRYRCADWNRRR